MGYSYDSMRLAVYMLEDGLIYDQRNFTSYYGGADPIIDFVHDDVLRRSLTNVFGDNIPSDEVGHGKTYSRDFEYAIPGMYNKSNIKLILRKTFQRIDNYQDKQVQLYLIPFFITPTLFY